MTDSNSINLDSFMKSLKMIKELGVELEYPMEEEEDDDQGGTLKIDDEDDYKAFVAAAKQPIDIKPAASSQT